MKWFSKKNTLDEMQELKLLQLESHGYWLGFWGLFLSIIIQVILYDREAVGKALAGEFIVFLCMAVYLIAGCLKNGIWDRRLKATPAVNIGVSLAAATVTGLFNAILSYRDYQSLTGAVAIFAVYFYLVGITLSVTLCLCAAIYQKKKKQLEEDVDEDIDTDLKED